VDLLSRESIRDLVQGFVNPTRVGVRHGAQHGAPPVRDRRMRCKCGQCAQCLDNARWERIFAEKFADPNYYTRSIDTHMSSPLASL